MRPLAWTLLAGLAAIFLLGDLWLDVRVRDGFSWMDPQQYYEFARDVTTGARSMREFELPSLFPLALLPGLSVSTTPAAALAMNVLWCVGVLFVVTRLAATLGLSHGTGALAGLMVLTSPLLVGLSRSLYLELFLTMIVGLTFWRWLVFLDEPKWSKSISFAACFGFGVMTKMTFPLFFVGPVGFEIVRCVMRGRFRELAVIVAPVTIATGLVILAQYVVFPTSFEYYLSLGNTVMPPMRMIGPFAIFSFESATYYFRQLSTSMLGFVAIFLILPILAHARGKLIAERKVVALWWWLLLPLALLVLQPVKEPRHVAPCIPAAILLILLGARALPSQRAWVLGAAFVVSFGQYLWVTRSHSATPYFVDRPLLLEEIERGVAEAAPRDHALVTPGIRTPETLLWRFGTNFVIVGFDGNEALALANHFVPAVLLDLDSMPSDDEPRPTNRAYTQFEDAYFVATVNVYNRRTGYEHYHEMISQQAAIEFADFALVKHPATLPKSSNFEVASILESEGSQITIFVKKARASNTTYRELYARAFEARNPSLSTRERGAIGTELFFAAISRGDFEAAREIRREYGLSPSNEIRNIYWIGAYAPVHQLAREKFRAFQADRRASQQEP